MKIQLLVIAASLCAASAGMHKRLFEKYTKTKVMADCFGEQVMADIAKEMAAARAKCHGEPTPEMPQSLLSGHMKLGSDDEEMHDKLEMMRTHVMSMMGNLTCTMRETKMLDADNQVDFDAMKQRIMSMSLPKDLVDDLYQAMDQCRELSSCLPSSKFEGSPIMAHIGRQLAFFKCFKMAKMECCMKHDMRGAIFPTLMGSRLGMLRGQGLSTIISSAMLQEAMDM